MALRALMKRKELDRVNKDLADLRARQEGFAAREAELEGMIEEAETEEERAAVEEEITAFEAEQAEVNEGIESLEGTVRAIETELAELETEPDPEPAPAADPEPNERSNNTMVVRARAFRNMDMQTRDAMFAREDVQSFLTQVRNAISEKRAITGAGLLVPEVFLGLVRENIMEYSKLYKHVNLRPIGGNGREVVMGTIPEAVWTDCCGVLNELDLQFNDAEVGCWKVAGYFDICNATLEDSDIDLASELLTVLGQAIGFALDKAILYGLGTRMPMGIVTRLAQTSAPADYPATARTWVDLHTTNIKKTNTTGIDLFKWILTTSAASKGKYSRGERVWVMNDTTFTKLRAEGLSINAAGAIVSGINGTMPVAGGVVEVLDFIPDYDIITGYFDLYLLAERAGIRLDQSEHVKFIEDRTVFRGTARYDGLPVIAEGFALMNINNTNPTTTITFAPDTANAQSE